jgi:uncharacterized protein (PEP-CTERM system associated)
LNATLPRAGAIALLAASLAAGVARSDSLRIAPNAAVTESYSDNVGLVPREQAQSGWVTDVVPGLRAELAGARVKGLFDYRVSYTTYAGSSRPPATQRFLNAMGRVEALEDLLFVDARADITNQNRSAFGAAVAPGVSTPSANRIETTSYQVAPSVRGHLSDMARYQARVVGTIARTNDVALPDIRTTEWAGRISNPSPSALVGWSVDLNALSLRIPAIAALGDTRLRASVVYAITPQMHVSLSEGHEATDFAGPPRRGSHTPGAGLEWSPSVRTQLSAVYERRFFGGGHSVLFSHRTPLTAWKLMSGRDAAVLPSQLASSRANSIEGLMSDLLTSAIPDPVARAAAVRRRLEDTGIAGTSALNSSFFTTRPFLFRQTVAYVALLGATNTAALTLPRREQSRLGAGIPGLGIAGDEDFRQQGLDANVAHKLSPLTTLTFTTTSLRTQGLSAAGSRALQRLQSLFLVTRISPRTSASVGIRRAVFESSTASESYRENAVFGSVSIRL